MNELLVQVENLYKTYRSGKEDLHILRGVEFSVSRGLSLAITGESGSGKSTLLNILGGLDDATSGLIRVGNRELSKMSEKDLTAYRSSTVGFVFQFHYLLKDFTALENVMLPACVAGMRRSLAKEKARELLAEVRLEDRVSHFPSQLSGGERQRVAVARAMINNPELILADEPTGNLDPENSGLVADLLYATAETHGKTLIVVTHDNAVAARASRHLSLQAGVFTELERA